MFGMKLITTNNFETLHKAVQIYLIGKLTATCAALLSAGALAATAAPSESRTIAPATLEVLPLGSVRAEGWLLRQLEKQRNGVTGHAEELYDDIGNSDWLTNAGKGGQYDWERGPYYAKGLVALALTLDDAALKAKARRWVDAALTSQRPDGDFGPKKDNWWANMIVLHYLRDWAEATGDVRVEPFLRRYFDYQLKRLPEHPLSADSAWAACRAGDELEVVLWLYDRTGDAGLLKIADLLVRQCSDWTTYYHDGGDGSWKAGYRIHIVNFMQGLKFPALKSRLTHDAHDRMAYDAAFDPQGWAMRMNGRPDRMVNGTEPLSGRDAAQGTELCAIAERILSCRDVIATTGNTSAADDMEIVAFNSLPATLGDDGRGLRYYLVLNQPRCQKKGENGFECNRGGDATTPGLDAGFGCCRSNYHFAWPKFVQSLWMRRDGGLAAVAYAPSRVTTETATIRTSGSYPFGDDVRLDILQARGGTWPLFVRIPTWCTKPCVAVNGQTVGGATTDGFIRIEREWRTDDRIELSFPAEARLEMGVNDSRAVRRGPLVYAFAPKAKITEVPERLGFGAREYQAAEAWNWALALPEKGEAIDAAFAADAKAVADDPFRHGSKPCRLTVRAGKTPYAGWGTHRTGFTLRAIEPPPSPVPMRMVSDVREVELVPLGATQIRLTLLPWFVR